MKKPSTLFFAGRFDEALRTLIPAIKERPGVVPYVIATIYLRMERHAEGIPYALQACIDTPEDIHYRWMLRTLTLQSGQPESAIPREFRLKALPASPAKFQVRDVTHASGAGRLALGRGAAWGDFDNDGREDILVGSERAPFVCFVTSAAELLKMFQPRWASSIPWDWAVTLLSSSTMTTTALRTFF